MEILYLLIAGAIGALVKDVVEDNAIVLPKKIDRKITLGFLGSMIVGAFVGWVADQNILMAALSGYAGVSAIENLLLKKPDIKIR